MTDKSNPLANETPDVQVLSHTIYTKQVVSALGRILHLLFLELDTIPPDKQTSEWCWDRLINLTDSLSSPAVPYEYVVAARNGLHEIYEKTHPKSPPDS